MQVADLKLCKELYELSGWTMTEFYHIETNSYVGAPKDHWGNTKVGDIDEALRWTGKRCPAYDLGYLLRKLPETIPAEKYLWRFKLSPLGKGWNTAYSNHSWVDSHKSALKRKGLDDEEIEAMGYWRMPHYADTPEDAVAKPAIELFKQGVLKKGDTSA